ncbi:hypothetical protein MASR1M32_26390 [Rhodobacter sp.]
MSASAAPPPGQACQLFAAEDIYVSIGVNAGDGLDLPDAVIEGDIYELDPAARPLRLVMTRPMAGSEPRVAQGPPSAAPAKWCGWPPATR